MHGTYIPKRGSTYQEVQFTKKHPSRPKSNHHLSWRATPTVYATQHAQLADVSIKFSPVLRSLLETSTGPLERLSARSWGTCYVPRALSLAENVARTSKVGGERFQFRVTTAGIFTKPRHSNGWQRCPKRC